MPRLIAKRKTAALPTRRRLVVSGIHELQPTLTEKPPLLRIGGIQQYGKLAYYSTSRADRVYTGIIATRNCSRDGLYCTAVGRNAPHRLIYDRLILGVFGAMKHDPQQIASVFRIDVSADSASSPPSSNDASGIVIALLRQLVTAQERQNQLMEELIQQTSAAQKQRANELGQWKEANPGLARDCRAAAETLSQVQTSFLRNLTDEVMENQDSLTDGEFMLNEFVDRFGPRLAHLNGVLQVLSQLSSQPATANNA